MGPRIEVDTNAMRTVATGVRTTCEHLQPFNNLDGANKHGPSPSELVFGVNVVEQYQAFRSAWAEEGVVIHGAMTEAADHIDASADRYDETDRMSTQQFGRPHRYIPE
jgi:hypothetical protein